jgi:hypothetical protein
MQGDPQDTDAPGRMLDHGQDIGLGAIGQVGREEVACQDRLGLGPQELRPVRGAESRSRRSSGPPCAGTAAATRLIA